MIDTGGIEIDSGENKNNCQRHAKTKTKKQNKKQKKEEKTNKKF